MSVIDSGITGWHDDLTGCRSEEDLPATARDYLKFVADYVGVPVKLISVGPGRDQVIWAGDQAQGPGTGTALAA